MERVPSPFNDLDRPPLREAALRRALVVDGGLWTRLDVVAETGSTNTDVAALAAAGAPEGAVVVAEHQASGKGRAARTWTAAPRSGLTVSVLLRPPAATRPAWGWLPLLAGVSVAAAVRRYGEIDARLKWPNDVLVEERKLAGVLAEVVGGAVVVGIGLNVSLREAELPVPGATSLALAGSEVTDRDTVLRALLRGLAERYRGWVAAGGDPVRSGLLPAYIEISATLGRDVVAHLPGGGTLTGRATGVDLTGALILDTADGPATLAAGDVTHLRLP